MLTKQQVLLIVKHTCGLVGWPVNDLFVGFFVDRLTRVEVISVLTFYCSHLKVLFVGPKFHFLGV